MSQSEIQDMLRNYLNKFITDAIEDFYTPTSPTANDNECEILIRQITERIEPEIETITEEIINVLENTLKIQITS